MCSTLTTSFQCWIQQKSQSLEPYWIKLFYLEFLDKFLAYNLSSVYYISTYIYDQEKENAVCHIIKSMKGKALETIQNTLYLVLEKL